MNIGVEKEAQGYWSLMQKLKECHTEAGRALILYMEMPQFMSNISNPRLINYLNITIEAETPNEKDKSNHAGL